MKLHLDLTAFQRLLVSAISANPGALNRAVEKAFESPPRRTRALIDTGSFTWERGRRDMGTLRPSLALAPMIYRR